MFDIDIISIAMAAAAMVAFAIPFYVNQRKVKKEKSDRTNKITALSKSHGLNIDIQDLWRNQYFVGLDAHQNKLIYIGDLDEMDPKIIYLDEVKIVKVVESSRMVGPKGNSRKVVDGLQLQLINNHGKSIGDLVFFDGDKFSDLVGEPILVKKWEATINAAIKNQMKKDSIVL
ncbi:hypothetical protein ACFSKL_14480 [Belliella marina]|uniref:Uncharacterized protein n=2 Tax=Belliella marina TaxID=1644146 RepID=A0ABW4VPL0_9BACT